MRRYLRLYGYFVQFSTSKSLEFRIDFFFRIVMDCLYYVMNFLFFRVLFNYTNLIGGWSQEQVDVFVGAIIVIDALQMTLFSNNLFQLPQFINKGELDYYLVRPVSTLFFMSLRDFAVNSFLNLAIASSLFAWTLNRYPEPASAFQIILFCFFIVNGTLLHYSLHMLSMLPTFWTHSAIAGHDLFFNLQHFAEKPDGIYKGILRKLLLTGLPFILMASLPARMFFEGFHWIRLVHILGVSAFFFGLVVILWSRGLRVYASASS